MWIIFLAFGALIAPASAHCYSVWHYKTPQHCERQHIAFAEVKHNSLLPVVRAPPRVISFVPLAPPDSERGAALDKLKRAMKAQEQ